MNNILKEKFKEKLSLLKSSKFQADDIELLLIYIRDYIDRNQFRLLKEFCHFIAHPKRTQGVIYDELDTFYSKFKYMPINKGDQLDYNNIPKDVFEILFVKAIDQLSDSYLKQELNKSKTELKNYIKNQLVKKNGSHYSAVNNHSFDEIRKTIKTIAAKYPDMLLTQKAIIKEIEKSIQSICKEINYTYDVTNITKHQNEITLTLLSLIQECSFSLHDNAIAQGHVTVSSNNNLYRANSNIGNMHFEFVGLVPVQQSFVYFQIISSRARVADYMPNPEKLIIMQNDNFGKLKPFKIIRDNTFKIVPR